MLGLGCGPHKYLPYISLWHPERHGRKSFARRHVWVWRLDRRPNTGTGNVDVRPSRAVPGQFWGRHLKHCLHRFQFSRRSDRPYDTYSDSHRRLLCDERNCRRQCHGFCAGLDPNMVCQRRSIEDDIAVELVRQIKGRSMSYEHTTSASVNRKSQAGLSLLETLISLAILLLVAAGIMGLATIATSTTETQGHLASRTTEYAQDKMEQLLALTFCDGPPNATATDTTVFPAVVNTTGTGLAGCTNPGGNPPTASSGGSVNPASPTAGYVDYLDASGNLVAS